MLTQWHISDPSNVVLNSPAEAYKNFMEEAFLTLPPYNVIIALLPCDRLWNWLGEQLLPFVSATNSYSFWIVQQNANANNRMSSFVDNTHLSLCFVIVPECL